MDGSKEVKAEDVFDGNKQNYGNFVKLIEDELNATRIMEALAINIKWILGGETDVAKRVLIEEGLTNIFESNKASKEAIKKYSNLV